MSRKRWVDCCAAAMLVLALAPAWASNGYELNGWGSSARGLSGAGVALADDPMVAATNPAGIVALRGRQWQAGGTILHARPAYEAGELPPGDPPPDSLPLKPGRFEGDPDQPLQIAELFAIPHAAISWRLRERAAFALALYGNGGLNATFREFDNPQCPDSTPQSGPLCFGTAASNIAQIFVAPTYAYRLTDWLRVGASLLGAWQTIELRGLQIFAPQSQDPDNLSNNGHDDSFGYGAKIGAQLRVAPRLQAGLVVQSRVYMQPFEDYAGLLADQGDFDIPPYVHVGLAWDASSRWTLLADFQTIFYSSVDSLGNPSDADAPLGADNGPGFGWRDVDVYKFAARYTHNRDWTWRLGYTDNQQPVRPRHVFFNLLAGSLLEEHFNLGFSHRLDANNNVDMALMWAPKQRLAGPNPMFPGQDITLELEGFSIDVSWRRRF